MIILITLRILCKNDLFKTHPAVISLLLLSEKEGGAEEEDSSAQEERDVFKVEHVLRVGGCHQTTEEQDVKSDCELRRLV